MSISFNIRIKIDRSELAKKLIVVKNVLSFKFSQIIQLPPIVMASDSISNVYHKQSKYKPLIDAYSQCKPKFLSLKKSLKSRSKIKQKRNTEAF